MAAAKIRKALSKSEQMARIPSKDTQPELFVRRTLSRLGVRYRLHRKDLPGRPDLYVPRLRLAVFVNGCFWHGHNCPKGRPPKSNVDFWRAKIERNIDRDAHALRSLADRNVESLVVWTCELETFDQYARDIYSRYRSGSVA